MQSKLDICNNAMAKIGLTPFANLNSKEALKTASLLPFIINSTLRDMDCNWNFAKKQEFLALKIADNKNRYSYKFVIPSDCIKCLSLYPVTGNVKIKDWQRLSNRELVCGESVVMLEYISSNIDIDTLDSIFIEAITYKLASDLAITYKASIKISSYMNEQYLRTIQRAVVANNMETGDQDETINYELINSRL